MNKIKLIGLVMVYLVVVLPFYVSSVFAVDNSIASLHLAEDIIENGGFGKVSRISSDKLFVSENRISLLANLRNPEAYGQNGVNGYLKSEDQLTVKVTASNDDEVVTAGQVKLNNINFTSCVAGIEGYDCTLVWPPSGTWLFSNLNLPEIKLYGNESNLLTSLAIQLRVDSREPEIKSFDVLPEFGGGEDIEFSYSVEDYDFSGSTSYCSGLKQIEFYDNDLEGSLLATVEFDGLCSKEGVYSYTTSDEGSRRVCAIAYDRFDFVSAAVCDSFTVDNTAPIIFSLEILDEDDNIVEYIGGSMDAIVKVDFVGSDLDEGSVKADLRSLNDRSGYEDKRPNRIIETGEGFSAIWNVVIDGGADIDAQITIYAEDLVGNNISETISSTITYDGVAPIVNSLTSDISYEGSYYVRAGLNNFYADISEDGSGLGDVVLNINGERINGNCSGNECSWENVSINVGGGSLTAVVNARDKVGNAASQFSTTFLADMAEPVSLGVDVSSLEGENDSTPGYTATGDNLYVVAEFTDLTGIANAYADFSSFIDGADSVAADSCTNIEGKVWQCTWTTSSIDISGHIIDDIVFSVTDNIGNTLTVRESVEVLGVDDEANPNYWGSSVSCTPKLIDREAASLVNTRVYCHVDLKSSSSDIETLEIGIAGCYDNDGSLAYVSNAGLINAQPGSTDPYVMVELISDPMRISGLGFYCSLAIFSRVGNNIMRNAEFENVSISVGFYNMPLGELSDSVQDKIDDAKDFAWFLGSWVGTLNKISFYAKKICGIINTIYKVLGIFKAISMAIGHLSDIATVAQPIPISEALDKARIGMQIADNTVQETTGFAWKGFINKICKFFSCRLFYDEVWGLGGTSIGQSIGNFQRTVLEKADWVATGGGLLERVGIGGERGIHAYDWTDGRTGYETIITQDVLEPQDSIVISALTLCLPGIIYNLNKLRQIQCMYADCMENYVQQGLPLKACEDQKHYATCKYWYGEVFQLLPFTGIWSFFTGVIKNVIAYPPAMVDTVANFLCTPTIFIPHATRPANVCLINKFLGLITDVWDDIEGIFDKDSWTIYDYCDRIEEED